MEYVVQLAIDCKQNKKYKSFFLFRILRNGSDYFATKAKKIDSLGNVQLVTALTRNWGMVQI